MLRAGGDGLPALDPETWAVAGETGKGEVIPMDLENLLELFPTTTRKAYERYYSDAPAAPGEDSEDEGVAA